MAITVGSLIGRAVLPRRWRGFRRDQSGATAVEMGLLALPFFMIVGAILETSVVFLASQFLDSAVADTSRLVRTGVAKTTMSNTADFRNAICDRLYGLFPDCSGLHIEVKTISDFASATISPPIDYSCTSECGWTRSEQYGAGTGSSIMLVEVYYKWPIILNLGGLSLANLPDGKRLLSAATVFRNEPY
ncbi:TadE/TadG family type IV pilus assembly protein [Devosia aquimaris]|uniref:TadE/TadG family type IV pilus assembly protein n=1 Tax=Devosia aquimaris TaxID=2866214 RepID=UPI001CD0E914|nr:TadE/TadG family type IV pilus assembly protein [Devosia sp. CJK-A8-3]